MANVHRMTKKRLGELLLQEGVIRQEHLDESLEEQQQTGELIGDILVRRGFCTESDVARTISTQFSFPYISVMHYHISPEMAELFPLEHLEKNLFVPIDRFGDVLNVVVAGLLDQDVVEDIEKTTGCTAQVYVGMVSEVKQVIKEKFAKIPAKKPAAKSADVNVDVTAPPTEAPVTATATADLDPALADLEQALEAADSSLMAEADEEDAAPESQTAHGDADARGDEEEATTESQTAEAEPAEAESEMQDEEAAAAEGEVEKEDEQAKKKGRLRFFESE